MPQSRDCVTNFIQLVSPQPVDQISENKMQMDKEKLSGVLK